jgi:hypothetical protein
MPDEQAGQAEQTRKRACSGSTMPAEQAGQAEQTRKRACSGCTILAEPAEQGRMLLMCVTNNWEGMDDEGNTYRLVAVPFDKTFDSEETLQCMLKSLDMSAREGMRIESMTLHDFVDRNKHHEGEQVRLPLYIRPKDLEDPANEGCRKFVFNQEYIWFVNII